MATEFTFTNATSTGTSNVLSLSEGCLRPRSGPKSRTIYISGITTGEVEIQVAPEKDSAASEWITPADGTLTADGALIIDADGFVRVEITTATDVDVVAKLV